MKTRLLPAQVLTLSSSPSTDRVLLNGFWQAGGARQPSVEAVLPFSRAMSDRACAVPTEPSSGPHCLYDQEKPQ